MKLIAFMGASGSARNLRVNPDNVTIVTQADKGQSALCRIWVNGGDYFTVNGTVDEVSAKLTE